MKLYPVYVSDCQQTGLLLARAATVPCVTARDDLEVDVLGAIAEGIARSLAAGVEPQPAKPIGEGWWLRWVEVEEPQQADPPACEWCDDMPPIGTLAATDSAVLCSLAERLAAVEAKVEALAKAGEATFPHLEAAMRAERLTLAVDPVDEDEWRAQLSTPGGGVAMVGGKAMRRYGVTAEHAVARLERAAGAAAKEGKAT